MGNLYVKTHLIQFCVRYKERIRALTHSSRDFKMNSCVIDAITHALFAQFQKEPIRGTDATTHAYCLGSISLWRAPKFKHPNTMKKISRRWEERNPGPLSWDTNVLRPVYIEREAKRMQCKSAIECVFIYII